MKRFFLLDTFTDRNATFKKRIYNDRGELQRFQSVRYVKDIELLFTINNDHSNYPNRISIPLLKVIYGDLNITNLNAKSFDVYLDFQIKVEFVKNYEFSSTFDVTKLTLFYHVNYIKRFTFADPTFYIVGYSFYFFYIPNILLQNQTTETVLRSGYIFQVRCILVLERRKCSLLMCSFYQHLRTDNN